MVALMPNAESVSMARQVAIAFKSAISGSVTLIGAKVWVNSNNVHAVTYDFTDAPKTGYVSVSTSGSSTTVLPVAEFLGEKERRVAVLDMLGIAATGLAVEVALAAARAIAQNFIDHPGQTVDKSILIQKVVASMAQAAGNRLGLSFANVDWTPVASQIISSVNSTAFDGVMTTAMGFIGHIKNALQLQLGAHSSFIARTPRLV
jgi:hypothetical protein